MLAQRTADKIRLTRDGANVPVGTSGGSTLVLRALSAPFSASRRPAGKARALLRPRVQTEHPDECRQTAEAAARLMRELAFPPSSACAWLPARDAPRSLATFGAVDGELDASFFVVALNFLNFRP